MSLFEEEQCDGLLTLLSMRQLFLTVEMRVDIASDSGNTHKLIDVRENVWDRLQAR